MGQFRRGFANCISRGNTTVVKQSLNIFHSLKTVMIISISSILIKLTGTAKFFFQFWFENFFILKSFDERSIKTVSFDNVCNKMVKQIKQNLSAMELLLKLERPWNLLRQPETLMKPPGIPWDPWNALITSRCLLKRPWDHLAPGTPWNNTGSFSANTPCNP